jgi:hypothetical protein
MEAQLKEKESESGKGTAIGWASRSQRTSATSNNEPPRSCCWTSPSECLA